jgi:hypothetical protein
MRKRAENRVEFAFYILNNLFAEPLRPNERRARNLSVTQVERRFAAVRAPQVGNLCTR